MDIETAPMVGFLWGLYDQDVAINQIVSNGYTLCWSAKFLGDRKIYFGSVHNSTPKQMLREIHSLLSEADITITYNGIKFDLPILNQEFALNNFAPPSPSHHIDLLRVVRRSFRLPSNKLEYVCRYFGIGGKIEHKGMKLWEECMQGDTKAWNLMKRYNIQDVKLLEPLYHKLLPWIRSHPNLALYLDDDRPVCHNCGSRHVQRRGWAYTRSGKYRRFQCQNCKSWLRDRRKEKDRVRTLTQVA